jgi:hypothetical protein
VAKNNESQQAVGSGQVAKKRFTIRGRDKSGPVPAHANLTRDTAGADIAYTDNPFTANALSNRGFEVIDNETGDPYDGKRHTKAKTE